MAYLPTPCPECNGTLTMEVIDVGPDDWYQAKCTDCGCIQSGRLEASHMISRLIKRDSLSEFVN